MKDNQDTAINTNPERGPAFASRRTIVKGLASAVPVVMTIGCGKAMANASSFQCIAEPIPKPTECIDPADFPNGDGWFRVPTEINVKNKGATTTTTQQCLVYVDEEGNQVTKGKSSFPVTLSCYASFM